MIIAVTKVELLTSNIKSTQTKNYFTKYLQSMKHHYLYTIIDMKKLIHLFLSSVIEKSWPVLCYLIFLTCIWKKYRFQNFVSFSSKLDQKANTLKSYLSFLIKENNKSTFFNLTNPAMLLFTDWKKPLPRKCSTVDYTTEHVSSWTSWMITPVCVPNLWKK